MLKNIFRILLLFCFISAYSMNLKNKNEQLLWSSLEVAQDFTGCQLVSLAKFFHSFGKPCISCSDIKNSYSCIKSGVATLVTNPANFRTAFSYLQSIFTLEKLYNTNDRANFFIRNRCNLFIKPSFKKVNNSLDKLTTCYFSPETKKAVSKCVQYTKVCAGVCGMAYFINYPEAKHNLSYFGASALFTFDAYTNYSITNNSFLSYIFCKNY